MSTGSQGLTEQLGPSSTSPVIQDPRAAAAHDREVRTVVAWFIIAIASLVGFIALTWLVASGSAIPFDRPMLDYARGYTAYTDLWKLLSDAANLPLIVIGVGLVLWLLATHRRREGILAILILVAVTAGSEAIKQLVARPRPPGSDTVVPGVIYSYPSGHVLEAVTIFGIIAILVWRSSLPRWLRIGFAVIVAIFVALVGFARVAIDAHYPSDVLAGLLAGIGVIGLFAVLTSGARRRHPPVGPTTDRDSSVPPGT